MKLLRPALPLLIVLTLIASTLCAQVPAPPRRKLLGLLHESLSGETAKKTSSASRGATGSRARGDTATPRDTSSPASVRRIRREDAFVESFLRRKNPLPDLAIPSGWDISSAQLRMVEPYDERIAGHPEVAMSVMPDSNPGDVMADLVWVGAGTSDGDYKGKDVKGKFVLATGYGGSVHRLAVLKYGAKAVVCYLDDERAMEYPDMLAYTGMWPKPDELASTTFGFNLTNRQGEKLRSLLLSGSKVVLRGWVKGTGLEPYAMDVVVARIHGTDMAAVELVFARTSTIRRNRQTTTPAVLAAILDIARTLKGLIDEGASPVRNGPSGSSGSQWYGTMAYIDAHPELTDPALAERCSRI